MSTASCCATVLKVILFWICIDYRSLGNGFKKNISNTACTIHSPSICTAYTFSNAIAKLTRLGIVSTNASSNRTTAVKVLVIFLGFITWPCWLRLLSRLSNAAHVQKHFCPDWAVFIYENVFAEYRRSLLLIRRIKRAVLIQEHLSNTSLDNKFLDGCL